MRMTANNIYEKILRSCNLLNNCSIEFQLNAKMFVQRKKWWVETYWTFFLGKYSVILNWTVPFQLKYQSSQYTTCIALYPAYIVSYNLYSFQLKWYDIWNPDDYDYLIRNYTIRVHQQSKHNTYILKIGINCLQGVT